MDWREKALTATLLIVVFLSLALAPTWFMAFLILFGVIGLAVHKENKEEPTLPVHGLARSVDAPGQAVDAPVDAPALALAAVATGRYMRRKPVNEEVERVTSRIHDPLLRAPSNPVGTSEASSLRLQFVAELPKTIFTNRQIKAMGATPLTIELVDGRTNDRVTSGPLSSIEIEIVVLDGKFGSDKGEDWTEEEFNCNITCGREGRRPLITGELAVVLQGGIGYLRNLSITDHSTWTRSKRFRLGARAAQKVSVETRIREARSEAFTVLNFHSNIHKFSQLCGEGKKHYPPSLNDEVWRLVKVAKDGHRCKRMASRGIKTVQDFLQLYEADVSSLRNILGKGTSEQSWEEIIRHASTCVVDDNKMYAFDDASNKASILFNSVMKVAQATLDGETHQSVDKLTDSQKILVQELKRVAYRNKNQWVALDPLPSITPPRAPTNLPA